MTLLPADVGLSRYLITLGLATLASFLLTPLMIALARKLAIFDIPGGYKAHLEPTPLLGGVGLMVAVVLAVFASPLVGFQPEAAKFVPLVSGLAVVLLAGLIDDLRGLSARYKLLWQVGAATVAAGVVGASGIRLSLFLSWDVVPITLLTVVWIVGITNAVNLLDNMNGLCTGIGVVVALSLALYNVRTGQETVALIAMSFAGASLGFLPYNWPKARIFLGDVGSMTMGFALATLSVMGVYTPGTALPKFAVLAPLFLLAIPIVDAVIVVVLRFRAGHPPWIGDRRHVSHRLVRRGLRPELAVVVVWLSCAVCGLAALLIPVVGVAEMPLLVALVACTVVALAIIAGNKGLE